MAGAGRFAATGREEPMDAAALIGSVAACLVMAGAAAVTAWRIDAAARRDGELDDYFWVVFGGVVTISGAGAVAAYLGAGWAAVAVGAASTTAALTWVVRHHDRRRRLTEESACAEVWADLCRRHDAVVRRWADYDLDPAKAITYPDMHRPGNAAGRPVVHALRAAGTERARAVAAGEVTAPDATRYSEAVARLEDAFEAAEQRVRVPEVRHGARHRAPAVRP